MVEVKTNFKTKYWPNLTCYFCPQEDSQSHLLDCQFLTQGLDTSGIEYENIFQDIKQQEKIARLLNQILKQRNILLKMQSNNTV